MDFLKEILGEELYSQVEAKINEHNGNEANKDKQIKVANLESGDYVGKGKYDALDALLKGKETELKSANDLISQLQKDTKGNEALQEKISAYETEKANLQAELQETKIKAAIKVGLLAEHCNDVDYATYKLMEKLKEKEESLELDENDNIKGWDDKLSSLKTMLPNQFGTGTDGKKVLGVNKLPEGDPNSSSEPKTLAEALQQQYENNN